MRVDLSDVRPTHRQVHDQLLEWARWCKGGRGAGQHPMFAGYTPYLYPERESATVPIDSLRALATERAVRRLPEQPRAVIRWAYVHPYIPPHRVRRALGLTEQALAQAISDGRTMVRNVCLRSLGHEV